MRFHNLFIWVFRRGVWATGWIRNSETHVLWNRKNALPCEISLCRFFMIRESWTAEDWRRRGWSRTVESAFQCRACWTRSTNRCWVHARPKGPCHHWKALSTVRHQRVSKCAYVERLFVSPQINFITMLEWEFQEDATPGLFCKFNKIQLSWFQEHRTYRKSRHPYTQPFRTFTTIHNSWLHKNSKCTNSNFSHK